MHANNVTVSQIGKRRQSEFRVLHGNEIIIVCCVVIYGAEVHPATTKPTQYLLLAQQPPSEFHLHRYLPTKQLTASSLALLVHFYSIHCSLS
ncbi:hypothetical protein K491DRAFT_691231 [Lophiostoma macrostomum CBS 122681]|uniref:Uncharacterized protein n=1 Tax=Lophiostoma macrostomum CBS 122681 TaxID=1314788 RepID=A0A6A6TD07_9PLEO|nr:hypothetical protein K491DRAFT_691231 [Lophiostoma macrostomum CBS 122681]